MKTFGKLKPNDIVYNSHSGFIFERVVATINSCMDSTEAVEIMFFGDVHKITFLCSTSTENRYHACLEAVRIEMESYMRSLEHFEKKQGVSC